MADASRDGLRLGAWARAGNLVGLVARREAGQVTIFEPGQRQVATVPEDRVEAVPAGAVTVTATVDLPLAHGLDESHVRRWVASLLDETLRERALTALAEQGVDEGAALPAVRLSVTTMQGTGAVCLCGARVPAPPGAALACPACGRQAVAAPARGDGPGGVPR